MGDYHDYHPFLSEVCTLSLQVRRKRISVIDLDCGDVVGALDKVNGSFLSRNDDLRYTVVEEDFQTELHGSDWIRF